MSSLWKCDIQFSIVIKVVIWKAISEGSHFPCELRRRLELTMDPWVILPMERERHSQQFLSCQPTDGFITGTQVFYWFMKNWTATVMSQEMGLYWNFIPGQRVLYAGRLTPHGVSSGNFLRMKHCNSPGFPQIWGLADMNGDGKMDINEFSIACKLINLKLKGMELPKVPKKLPNCLIVHLFSVFTLIVHLYSVFTATNAWSSSSHQPARGDANGKYGNGNARCDLLSFLALKIQKT